MFHILVSTLKKLFLAFQVAKLKSPKMVKEALLGHPLTAVFNYDMHSTIVGKMMKTDTSFSINNVLHCT